MARKKRETVYRIQNPDGSFRGAGRTGKGSPKTWRTKGHLKSHLRVNSHWDNTIQEVVENAQAGGSEVVEYELREVRRYPVEELFDGANEEG